MNEINNYTFKAKFKGLIHTPSTLSGLKKLIKEQYTIVGKFKTYGDSCIGSKKSVSLEKFNKVINFDKKKKIIEVQSGMLLKNLMCIILKENLILRCTPGSKYLTVGGMIASNIQGKCTNLNNIKYYINSLKILNNKNKIIYCSKKVNKKYFDLTIGGFGFTGPIISAEFKLDKVASRNINQKIIPFYNYQNFYKHFLTKNEYQYSVVWIDAIKDKFSGLIINGNHSSEKVTLNSKKDIYLPFFLIKFLSFIVYKKIFIQLFNKIFYYKKLFNSKKIVHLYDFFFPQDAILNYNQLFKKNGFYQFQFSISIKNIEKIINEIKKKLRHIKVYSNFCVIKFMNNKEDINRLSLSMDIPINNNSIKIRKILNDITKKYELDINLSKDLILYGYNKNIENSNPFLKKKNKSFLFEKHTSQMIKRLKKIN